MSVFRKFRRMKKRELADEFKTDAKLLMIFDKIGQMKPSQKELADSQAEYMKQKYNLVEISANKLLDSKRTAKK